MDLTNFSRAILSIWWPEIMCYRPVSLRPRLFRKSHQIKSYFTFILHSGCCSLQWSHARILHVQLMVTCSSRSLLCIVTWQFSLVQKTSLKRQETKCSCCKNRNAVQSWFYPMCFAIIQTTSPLSRDSFRLHSERVWKERMLGEPGHTRKKSTYFSCSSIFLRALSPVSTATWYKKVSFVQY